MINEEKIRLISLCVGGVCGVLLYLFFRLNSENKESTIQTNINGYSMKYHYFVWWFLLPARITNNLLSYMLYEDYINIFPMNIILLIMFILVILNIITFVGFFTFKKYSWYTIIILNVLAFFTYTIDALFYPNSSIAAKIGRIIGSILPSVLEFIYYYKRKGVFINESKYVDVKNNIINYHREDFNIRDNSINMESDKLTYENIKFCRKCGTEISEGSIFCRKCGLKVDEKEV